MNPPARWTRQLGARTDELLAVAEHALAVDGVAPLSGHVLDALASAADDYLLLPDQGRAHGVAVAHDSDPGELVVDPDRRRAGLGSSLLTAVLDRSGAVWAHGDLPAARALAAAFGLVRTRELVQMRRSLDPGWAADQVAAAALPAGVRIRTFVPGRDEQQFLGVNARAFDWHPEQGRLDAAGFEREKAQPWFDPAGFFLAVDAAGTVLGFHWTKVHGPDLPVADQPGAGAGPGASVADQPGAGPGTAASGSKPLGEVYVLGVDPAGTLDGAPVRGLGTPLTAAGLQYLADRGLDTVLLYVEGDNDRALALYRRLGFAAYSTDVVYRRADRGALTPRPSG